MKTAIQIDQEIINCFGFQRDIFPKIRSLGFKTPLYVWPLISFNMARRISDTIGYTTPPRLGLLSFSASAIAFEVSSSALSSDSSSMCEICQNL